MRIERVGKTSPGMKIDTINVNQCSLGNGKQMVFWVSKMGLDFDSEAASRVGYVELWTMDRDSVHGCHNGYSICNLCTSPNQKKKK